MSLNSTMASTVSDLRRLLKGKGLGSGLGGFVLGRHVAQRRGSHFHGLPPRSHCAGETGVAPLNVLLRGNRGRIETAHLLTGDAHQPYRLLLGKHYFGEFIRAFRCSIVHLRNHG